MILQATDRPSLYYFLLPVWGQEYAEFFCNFALPSQLSPNNLPALKTPIKYMIFCDHTAFNIISSSPSYKALGKIAEVELIPIKKEYLSHHERMSYCYKLGIKQANKNDCPCFYLIPDAVFSDGSFQRAEEIIQSGKRIIYNSGIRLEKEKGQKLLSPFLTPDKTELKIFSHNFVNLALNSLHAWAYASFLEEGINQQWLPSNFYWRVEQEGILAFCFHLHPLFIWPRKKINRFPNTIDSVYPQRVCPADNDIYVVQDSNEILMGEFSRKDRPLAQQITKHSLDDLLFWMTFCTDKRHRNLVLFPTYIHTGKKNLTAWRRQEKTAEKYVKKILDLYNTNKWQALKRTPFRSVKGYLGQFSCVRNGYYLIRRVLGTER